jgi:hypothetical protein
MILFCFFMMRRFGMSCWMGCCKRDTRSPYDPNNPSTLSGPPKEKIKGTF